MLCPFYKEFQPPLNNIFIGDFIHHLFTIDWINLSPLVCFSKLSWNNYLNSFNLLCFSLQFLGAIIFIIKNICLLSWVYTSFKSYILNEGLNKHCKCMNVFNFMCKIQLCLKKYLSDSHVCRLFLISHLLNWNPVRHSNTSICFSLRTNNLSLKMYIINLIIWNS